MDCGCGLLRLNCRRAWLEIAFVKTSTIRLQLPRSKFGSKFGSEGKEEKMDRIMTELTTTISEFKKNPNAAVKKAKKKPFAVLTNNKPTFYVMSPELYDEIEEILWEIRITPLLKKRMSIITAPSILLQT